MARAVFSPNLCGRCKRFVVVPCYPAWPEVCAECEVRCRCPFVAVFLRHVLRCEPHAEMVTTVAGFCATNRTPRQRLHFLHNVLLSRHSCFRQFTLFAGDLRGIISQTENVLDRIMSFLGGVVTVPRCMTYRRQFSELLLYLDSLRIMAISNSRPDP